VSLSPVESVPHAVNARYDAGPGGLGLDLLAQIQHVRVDDAVGDGGAGLPRSVDELLAAQHPATAADEGRKQPELERGDVNAGPAYSTFSTVNGMTRKWAVARFFAVKSLYARLTASSGKPSTLPTSAAGI